MIKKLIVLFFVFSSFTLFAQEQKQNSDVQLPDFVITGKDIVTIKKAKKIPPDFVSTISTEFIKPVQPNENLPVKELKTPIKGAMTLIDSLNYLSGSFSAGMGIYALPSVNLNFTAPFNVGMLEVFGNGINNRAYVTNSENYHINGGANLLFSINENSNFLPGSQIKFHGNFGTNSYKLFGSNIPNFRRVFNDGNASVSFDNLINKYFIFSAKLNDNISALRNENFSENMLKLTGFARLSLSNFNLGTDITYKKQTLKNDIVTNGSFDFIALKPYIGLSFSKLTEISLGINYEHTGSENFFSPYAALAFRVSKFVTLYGEFNPRAEFYGGEYFLKQSPYFMPQKFTNIFIKKDNSVSVSIKYQYFTYFEIDGGIRYYSTNNLPYFSDTSNIGMFNLETINGKSSSVFVNALFHPGPSGVFYGSLVLTDTKDTRNSFIPYYPRAKLGLNYSYSFNFGLTAGAGVKFYSGIYTNLMNQSELKSFIDAGLNFSYEINPNFYLTLKLSNLLNNKNYLWKGYEETPFDLLGGINFRW
jgi:hypothetical protein